VGVRLKRRETAAEREQARKERRELIADNKAWKVATEVRRDWLRTLVARKAPPKATIRFIAQCLTDPESLRYAMDKGHRLAHELFGLPAPSFDVRRSVHTLLGGASEPRAQMVTLGYERQPAHRIRPMVHDHHHDPTTRPPIMNGSRTGSSLTVFPAARTWPGLSTLRAGRWTLCRPNRRNNGEGNRSS
jgi:hypothetical protein